MTLDEVIADALKQFDALLRDKEREAMTALIGLETDYGQVLDVDAVDAVLRKLREDAAAQRARLPGVIRAAFDRQQTERTAGDGQG